MKTLGRIATTIVGTRIAAESGRAGLMGAVAGAVATGLLRRSPGGALLVGGAYVAHKIWQKKKQIDAKGPHAVAVADGLAEADAPPLTEKRPPRRIAGRG